MAGVFNLKSPLSWMLIFVPAAIVLELMHANPIYVFTASAAGIIPLAGWMGRATEWMAEHLGSGIGGLLNATFGNAAELIIAIMALRAGLHEVVKASITGSIIGNLLLVLGVSLMAGGIRFSILKFNRTAASLSTTLQALSAIALIVPALFHRLAGAAGARLERTLSQAPAAPANRWNSAGTISAIALKASRVVESDAAVRLNFNIENRIPPVSNEIG